MSAPIGQTVIPTTPYSDAPVNAATIPLPAAGSPPSPGYVITPGNPSVQTAINSPAQVAPTPTTATPPAISVSDLSTPQTPVTVTPSPTVPPVSVPTPPAPSSTTATDTAPDYVSQLQDLESEALGKTADQSSAEETAQAPINDQIDQLNSLINQGDANLQLTANKISASGGDTAFQGRLVANATAGNAAQKLLLTAQVTALKGDLTTAKAQADAAIDAKYAQVTQDTQTARANIIANFDTMSPAQQETALDTLNQLDKSDLFVSQKVADEKAIQATVVTAAGNKASTSVLQQISSAATPADAEKIAADNNVGSDSNTAIHDIGGRALLINTKTGEVVRDLGASSTSGAASTTDVVSAFGDAIDNGDKLPDGVTPVVDANGFVTPAAFKAFVANNTPTAVTAVIKQYPTKFFAPDGTIDPGYGFNQTQINALTAALPQ